MNRFLTFGIASTLALGAIAGAASAAGLHGGDPGNLGGSHENEAAYQQPVAATGSGIAVHLAAFHKNSAAQTDRMIRHWKGGRFDVVPVGNLDDTAMKASIEDHASLQPRQVAALQNAIAHNHALDSRLKAENVQIRNIVDAETALDGGITFYVR